MDVDPGGVVNLIHPNTLRTHWPRIKASLDAVQAKASDDWIAEDVYHAIKAGAAACHLSDDGLLITTITHAEFSGTPALHVWIAHNTGGADVLENGLPMLREMARRAGVTKITFGSPRPGWAKRFPLVSATYEVPL